MASSLMPVNVRLGQVPEPEPAEADPQQQEQREIVADQRDVAQLRGSQPPHTAGNATATRKMSEVT